MVVLLAACLDLAGPGNDPASLTVSHPALRFDAVGASQLVSATVLDRKGRPQSADQVEWSSDSPGVIVETPGAGAGRLARLLASGGLARITGGSVVLRAGANGSATVEARIGELSATMTVEVAQMPAVVAKLAGDRQTGPVGAPLSSPLEVRVEDRLGSAIPNTLVSFQVVAGSGSVSSPSVTSGNDGTARVTWTLGTLAGPAHEVRVLVADTLAASFTANAVAGFPARLAVSAGQGQTAIAGSPVPVSPSVIVRDGFDNPVAAVAVSFTPAPGSGVVAVTGAATGQDGIATAGGWTLGPVAGPNTLSAQVAGLPPVQFTATGIAGPPASVTIQAGEGQSAPVGFPVPVPPAVLVRDGNGNPVPGAAALFAVTSGGGNLTGAAATTGTDGIAAAGAWVLGPVPGPNTVQAAVGGLSPVTFTATGIVGSGLPALISVHDGNGQAALPGSTIAVPPSVLVRDDIGQPVPGVPVTFAVTGGSGSITGASTVSDANGIATLGSWTVGPGANCLAATVSGLPPISFAATGIPAGGPGYDVQVQYLSCVTSAQEAAFANAASRWSTVIAGDVPDLTFPLPANSCSWNPGAAAQSVDDLVIFASVLPIDGIGKVLGAAGPCYIRSADSLPLVGAMFFDSADVASLEANGRLTDVIVHEMGHVIGIGSLWGVFNLRQDPSPVGGPALDTYHSGPQALIGFNNIGGSTYTGGNKVPVENQFGAGTINAHWREGVLANELMTGFLSAGSPNPLSELTVRSLADFGYGVNPAAADPFFLALALRLEPESLIALGNDVWVGPIYTVDREGRITRKY